MTILWPRPCPEARARPRARSRAASPRFAKGPRDAAIRQADFWTDSSDWLPSPKLVAFRDKDLILASEEDLYIFTRICTTSSQCCHQVNTTKRPAQLLKPTKEGRSPATLPSLMAAHADPAMVRSPTEMKNIVDEKTTITSDDMSTKSELSAPAPELGTSLDTIYIDPEHEKRVLKKFDKYLLPQAFVFIL